MRNEKGQRSESIVLKMESLRFRPLLLAHVEDILDSKSSQWNEYTTYDALLSAWLMREAGKSEGRVKAEELCTACTAIAEEMQVLGKRHFSRKRLERLLSEHPEVEQLSFIDLGGRSLLNRNSRGDYRFSHYTIQEFLMAKGVLNASLSHGVSAFRNTDQISKFVALAIVAGVVPADVSLVSSFVGSLPDPALLRKVSKALGWDSYGVIAAAVKAATKDVNVLIHTSVAVTPGDSMILDALAQARGRGVNVAIVSWGDRSEAWVNALSRVGLEFSPVLGNAKSAWFRISGESVGREGVKGLFEIDHHRLVQRAPVEEVDLDAQVW
jgi:hypothetical protein